MKLDFMRTDRLLLDNGKISVSAVSDILGEEIKYLMGFYCNGSLIFKVKLKVDKPNENLPWPKKLGHISLAKAIISFYKNISGLGELYNQIGEMSFDWILDNEEYFAVLVDECEEVLLENEGWIHYGDRKII